MTFQWMVSSLLIGSNMRPYHIMLADDHVLLRREIRELLESIENYRVIGEAGDGLELLEQLKSVKPDIAIIDIKMPNLDGLEATREIKRNYPEVKVLILTMHKEKEYLDQALSAGAEGYLLKEDVDSKLLDAVATILSGGGYFSTAR